MCAKYRGFSCSRLRGQNTEAANVLGGEGKCRDFKCSRLYGQNTEASIVLGSVGIIQRLQMF